MSKIETIVCPTCLHEHKQEIPFCEKCGAPLGAISTIGPLEHVHAEGAAYRRAVSGPVRPIVLFGLWFMFGPFVVAIPFFMIPLLAQGVEASFDFWAHVVGIMLLWVGIAALLYRVTRNYIRHRKGDVEQTPSDAR